MEEQYIYNVPKVNLILNEIFTRFNLIVIVTVTLESTGCWGQNSNGQVKKIGTTKSPGDLQIQGLLFHKNGEYQCQGLSELEAETLKALKETTLIVTGILYLRNI